ncbi:hypothetical protein [Natrinema halophilum]|uniref:Uncharacterized protein n=1 Tax=Natrinema halophilum TaxID=1699371 RepID=A0A7D5GIX3_9EURY|nr:hypothetical protein [Natrinema halophilum]QLG47870.1 hypothetical protein HYG82_02925 [Natrinema halophilum]
MKNVDRAHTREDDDVDESATLVKHLQIAQEFDDAEAREEMPELLEGGPMLGAHRYLVTGESDDAWLATNYVIGVGYNGGDRT